LALEADLWQRVTGLQLRRRPQPPQSISSETAPLAFRCSTPDTELLFVVECVFETLGAHLTLGANCARCFRRTPAFGEEDLGFNLGAPGVRLPFNGLEQSCGNALYSLHSPAPFVLESPADWGSLSK
jgi:hypothetical protein